MKLPQTGGCKCSAIRYEITQTPRMVYTCHCANCQRMTSSAFSMACVLPEGAFRIVRGEPKAVQHLADSGSEIILWICPECSSWVCASRPGATVRNVRGGTLDDTSWLCHTLAGSSPPWRCLAIQHETLHADAELKSEGTRHRPYRTSKGEPRQGCGVAVVCF